MSVSHARIALPMRRVAIVLAALLLASPAVSADTAETMTTLRTQALNLINRDRLKHRLPPVALDVHASQVGDAYCLQQIRNGTTGHYTTDGLSPYMRYSFAGGNDAVAENAAAWSASYVFSERALYEMIRRSQEAMMAEKPPDDGHRRAILDPHATHVGIGLAWRGGEFRFVQEFLRRHVEWTRPLPRLANLTDVVSTAGRGIGDAKVEAITVHHEPFPGPLAPRAASAIESYALPASRKEYLPRLRSDYTRREDGTLHIVRREYTGGHRGDFFLGEKGEFSFTVPFPDGPGIYTVVVWVRRPGAATPVAASNVSIRVEGALQSPARSSAGGHQ